MTPFTRDQVLQELEQNFRSALSVFIGKPRTAGMAARIRAAMMVELQKIEQVYPFHFAPADLETVAILLAVPLLGLPESTSLVTRVKELPDIVLYMFANNTPDTEGKLSPFHLLWVEKGRREKTFKDWDLRWDEHARMVTLDVYANPQTEIVVKETI